MSKIAFIFPGQGAQKTGMGKDFYEQSQRAAEIYDAASKRLKEEMEIAGFYLYLQSERFKDIITYNIEWESDEIKECYVPRLCIEPIVENAVIHGLEPKGTEGRIRVAIREASEDSINIVVEDDGVGFNVNEMDDRKDNKNPRVGVMNIQRLIRNLYGDKYGVLFQSEIGKGTIVTVCLPMRKDRTV